MSGMDRLTEIDDVDVQGWAAFKGHHLPTAIARHIADSANAHRRASQAAPAPLKLLDRADDEAFEWVTKNLCAVRRDNGSMEYGLQAVIRAFQAGKAAPAVEICQFCHDAGASACACFEAAEMGHAQAAPAPSDGLREALERIAEQQMYRSGYDQTDISVEPVLSASEMQEVARAALSASPTQQGECHHD